MPYQKMEHTADVRILAQGKDLKELFSAALLGMNEIITGKENKEKENLDIVANIEIEGANPTELLVDFLSEALLLSHSKKAVFPKINFHLLEDEKLSATLFGGEVKEFKEDIKAVTYHEAEIKQVEKGKLETILIFDI